MVRSKGDEAFEIMRDILKVFAKHDCSPAIGMVACIQTLCVIAAGEGKDFRDIPDAVDGIVGKLCDDADWRTFMTNMGEWRN